MSETLTHDRVTIQEAAKTLNIARKTIYRLIDKGLLSREKEGNRAYVSLAGVRSLCDRGDTQQDTENVTDTQQDTLIDTQHVTLDREHYEGLLIRLGQLESEKRYLLEYKTGLETKDKALEQARENINAQAQELATVKGALDANAQELEQARGVISRARQELERIVEIKQDAEQGAEALRASEQELDRLRAENKRLKQLRWWEKLLIWRA